MTNLNSSELITSLKSGGLAVIPTDTIYGVVCSALNPAAVERLYEVKQRDRSKACIVLISDLADLDQFEPLISPPIRQVLSKVWPGPTTVVLDCHGFTYLHRGKESLAFRWPADAKLCELIAQTGPLIAPSANPEGQPPATTIKEARDYFDDQISIYVDGGTRVGSPSRLIKLAADGTVTVLRG